jgi:signal transduction histidine kinase/CheY-like chemotaxis protein
MTDGVASIDPHIGAESVTGAEILSRNWTGTSLGPVNTWPASLKTTLAIMLACPTPMFLAWGDDLLCFYNDAYRPILGYRLATALGTPFKVVWASIWSDIEPLVSTTLAGESRKMTDMPLDLSREGVPERSWWTFTYSPAYDDAGQVAGLFCVTNEQTNRVQMEERHQTLAAEVIERREELARAEEQLRQAQKLEAIGRLTGGVAHDFNNLLTVIRGSVDLLRRPGIAEDKRARYIDAIGDTADRAAKLTGQLLAFSRRQALTPELFDLGACIDNVCDMIGTLIGSRIVLETHIPDQTIHALADRTQFENAIVNLAVNARDAMDGEGVLTIAAGAVSGIPAIRSHVPVVGDFIAVTVTDTGTGIDPTQIDRIYEPFFTTKDVGEGTGLGLSQVIGFAKQSGGDISVESVVGQGTTFTLYLPRAYTDEAEMGDHAAAKAPVSGEGYCVLVVEDNPQVGEFATQALKELGYDSILATDAEKALAALQEGCDRFHIVFSDVVMPGMNGIDLGNEIRRSYPGVPIVLTSGYSHVLARNGKHGFELLHKPYSVEQLSRVLHKAIGWQKGTMAKATSAG